MWHENPVGWRICFCVAAAAGASPSAGLGQAITFARPTDTIAFATDCLPNGMAATLELRFRFSGAQPTGQFYLAWIGLAPWLLVVRGAKSNRAAFFWSWLAGTLFFVPKGVRHGPHIARSEVISLTVFDGPLTVA